jgi:hypothetical protein
VKKRRSTRKAKKSLGTRSFNLRNLDSLYQSATENLSKIAKKPNVKYVTIGEKIKNGKPTGEPSIVVHVERKHSKLPKKDRVPKRVIQRQGRNHLRTYRTDVVVAPGIPTAFGARSGHRLRSFDNEIGVCGLSFRKNSVGYLLTNSHVVCAVAQGGVADRVRLFNRNSSQYEDVGPVVYATPLRPGTTASDDAAVVRSESVVVDDMRILDLGQPVLGFGSFNESLQSIYWYPVNGDIIWCDKPQPIVGGCDIVVDGVIVRYTQFWQLRVCRGASAHGHSGAVLYRTHPDGFVACGLLFGGIEPGVVFAFPIIPTFDRAWSNLA